MQRTSLVEMVQAFAESFTNLECSGFVLSGAKTNAVHHGVPRAHSVSNLIPSDTRLHFLIELINYDQAIDRFGAFG